MKHPERNTLLAADAALVAVTFVWGTTFVLVKDAISSTAVFPFLALRFGIASVVFLVAAALRRRVHRGRKAWDGHEALSVQRNSLFPSIAAGVYLGVFLFAGYAFQTYGLLYTSASKAGFVTGLSVVLVPLIGIFLIKARPGRYCWLGVVLSTLGMALLTMRGLEHANIGDALVLACAVAFAMQVVLIAKYSRVYDILMLCSVQTAVTCILAGCMGVVVNGVGSFIKAWSSAWEALLFLGVIATAGASALQMRAQKYTTATHAALVFALEPVFAAAFGWLVADERLTFAQWLGGAFILGGILVSELFGSGEGEGDLTGMAVAVRPAKGRTTSLG